MIWKIYVLCGSNSFPIYLWLSGVSTYLCIISYLRQLLRLRQFWHGDASEEEIRPQLWSKQFQYRLWHWYIHSLIIPGSDNTIYILVKSLNILIQNRDSWNLWWTAPKLELLNSGEDLMPRSTATTRTLAPTTTRYKILIQWWNNKNVSF